MLATQFMSLARSQREIISVSVFSQILFMVFNVKFTLEMTKNMPPERQNSCHILLLLFQACAISSPTCHHHHPLLPESEGTRRTRRRRSEANAKLGLL